jgi:steroid delta-isomerase-like uncharacterized protein
MSLVDEFLEAWNQQDGARVAGLFTEDGVYADHALNETISGHDAIVSFVKDAFAQFSSDMTFEPGFAVETPTAYAVEWTMKGTHDRDGAGVPRTGKPYSIPGISIGEVRGGKIVRNTDYWSLATFLRQVGIMPAPQGSTA